MNLEPRESLGEAIVYKTESRSNPGQWHFTTKLRTGEVECSCKGWQFTESCWHVNEFRLDEEGNAVLRKWNTLTLNQAFVLKVLAKGEATSREDVWWPLSASQVRGVLRRLKIDGYVEVRSFRRSAHVYAITKKGSDALLAHDAAT